MTGATIGSLFEQTVQRWQNNDALVVPFQNIRDIINNAYFAGKRKALTAEDRVCIPVPMYHCFGMVLGGLCCAAHGVTMVFVSPGFGAHETLKTFHEERCTMVHGVPTMFIAMLDDSDFSAFDLGELRTGIMAGAPCPEEVMKGDGRGNNRILSRKDCAF